MVKRVGAVGVRFGLDFAGLLLGDHAFLDHEIEERVVRFLPQAEAAGGEQQASCEKGRSVEATKR